MPLKVRQVPFSFFRLTFVTLTYAISVACLGTMALATVAGILIINVAPSNYDAFIATCGFTGVLGLVGGSIMLALMLDRRTVKADRRQSQSNINFPDRRVNNRRS